MDTLAEGNCLWAFLGATDGAEYCRRRDEAETTASELRRNETRQKTARKAFLYRSCVVKPRVKVSRTAKGKRMIQLGGTALKQRRDELADVMAIIEGDKPEPTSREMLALLSRVMTELFGGRPRSLTISLNSTLVPVFRSVRSGLSLEEITSMLERHFANDPPRDLAYMILPLLTTLLRVKVRIAARTEAAERASFKRNGMKLLRAFRAEHPDASQAMELAHMDEVALVGRV